MPTPNTKTLSPAELAKLEHAFATDPSSDAWKALAEAYLGMARFMEAMVVCKKGVKAHPSSPEPRVLLARVYADQGKDKKALEELAAALQIAPSDKGVLRLLGTVQVRSGEAEAGKASLLKAYQGDPSDADTLEAMKASGVEVPAPAAPPPAPVVAAPVVAAPAPVAATPAPVAATPAVRGPQAGPPVLMPVQQPAAPQVDPGVRAPIAVPAQPQQIAAPAAPRPPAPRPSGQRPAMAARSAARPQWDEDDEPMSDEAEVPVRRAAAAKAKNAKTTFFSLLVIVPIAMGGYYFWGQYRAKVARETRKALEAATEKLKDDSYASYQEACVLADKVLEVDPDSVAAHGYLAYAWAIRWGEHGGGDDARKKAEEHLKLAQEGEEESSHLYAAEALVKTYAGEGKEAVKALEERVKSFEAQGKRSSLLNLTLGLIQMNAGDLDRAQQNLDKAQALAPDDPRVYAALGTLYRRRGQDTPAWRNFDFALRYEKDHPESLLGKALLMLEQEDIQYYEGAAKMIKRLLEVDPPPSPRQLATAHLARAFLVSRVSTEVGYYKDDVQKKILEATSVPADKKKADDEIAREEETGFSLDRQNPELNSVKGRRLLLSGQTDAAVEEFRKAIKMDPTRAQFYVELARALMAKKDGAKEAAEALTTALKTMGDSPKLLLMLGQAYERQGQTDRAMEQFQKAMGDGKEKSPEARFALGRIYREKKDYEKAVDFLGKAAQEFVGQESRIAASYTELARALEEKGDREKAGETYQRAITADGEYANAYYFFARYLSQDKANAAKAKLAAKEYLSREPKGEFAADATRLAQ